MKFLSALFGPADPATNVDVEQARALLEEGALLIDVRERYEFRAGHAQGAKNIPLSQLSQRAAEIKPGRTVLVICQSGNRSRSARALLVKAQVADVRNVLGGTSAWQRARLPMQ